MTKFCPMRGPGAGGRGQCREGARAGRLADRRTVSLRDGGVALAGLTAFPVVEGKAATDRAEGERESGADEGHECEEVYPEADADGEGAARADGVPALGEIPAAVFEVVSSTP